jgi:NAD(P)-dependent dehydrogenase (short-subunit alcohol dehydrogenase family)
MSDSVETPVAIVTGAGRGLGREHALALARAGYAVVVNDLGGAGDGQGADATPAQQVVAEIEAMGGKAVADGSDVSNWKAAGELIDKAVATFGGLHALVNNAGILRDRTFANITEEDWDLSIAVNLKGTAAPLHHAARYWRDLSKKVGGPVRGAVVNTSSASGLFSNPGQGNYAAAKAGVASLTLVTARELARYGVRVNAIAPEAATRLTAGVMGENSRDKFDPIRVSPLVVYLLDPAAENINGRVFEVGGGAISVVDMPRLLDGRQTKDGYWTPEQVAETVQALEADMTASTTPIDAARFMNATPLTSI